MKPPPMPEPSKEGEKPAITAEQLEMIRAMKEMKILRKGQIGDWKNYLDESKWKQIDEMVASKLDYKKPIQFEPKK